MYACVYVCVYMYMYRPLPLSLYIYTNIHISFYTDNPLDILICWFICTCMVCIHMQHLTCGAESVACSYVAVCRRSKYLILEMQYLLYGMNDACCFCSTSCMISPILKRQALLRGPLPRQKWRYALKDVANIVILPSPLQDAFRSHSEVSLASFGRPLGS